MKQNIIPFSKDLLVIKEIIKSYDSIKQQFNNSLDDYVKYQNEIYKHEVYNTSSFSSHYYIVCDCWEDLLTKLKDQVSTKDELPYIVFVFGGQGGQYNKLMFEIYEKYKVFRDSIDEMDNEFKSYLGFSVVNKLKSIENEADLDIINNQTLTQIILGMVQISLFKLLKSWNITPSMIVGHSFGETPASFASNMIDLKTLCYLLFKRGSFQQSLLLGGLTMWMDIGENEFNNLFSKSYPNIEISCHFSFSNILVAGDKNSIESLYTECKTKSIQSKIFNVPATFHNKSQEIFKEEILQLKFDSNPPSLNHMSTVYGKLFNNNFYYDNQYMYDNLREPTRFTKSIPAIYSHIETNKLSRNVIFIEIGCRPTLLNYIIKLIPESTKYFSSISLLPTIQKDKGNKSLDDLIEYIKLKGYK